MTDTIVKTDNLQALLRSLLTDEGFNVVSTGGQTIGLGYSRSTSGSTGFARPFPLQVIETGQSDEGHITAGIICGTSTATPLAADHAIGTLISHGDASGSLHYMQTTEEATVVAGDGSATKRYSRVVTNNGATSITINEAALYIRQMNGSDYQTKFSMMIQKVKLETPEVVPAGESTTIRMTVNVPDFKV